MTEITNSLSTDYPFWPVGRHEAVKAMNIERGTPIIDEGADTIFLRLALIVMMMVVVMLLMSILLLQLI